ncbi:MAG: peptidylprolyl isomerase [Bacteroidota bacterium]
MKLFKRSAALVSLLISVGAFAQSPSIMSIDGKPVSKTEFEAIFKKNNKETKVTRQSLDEYIDLFVKFKLKVAEAERLGLDTNRSFTEELEGYRKQLAKPYLTDNALTDELIAEAYERMLTEVRASHILIRIGGAQTPADTLEAWKKIMDLKKKIEGGADFKATATEYSDDASAKQNGGDLGYFSGLTMVYSFESAAYNTPVGKISDPVRSSYGYHLIKVVDKRQAQGEVKVAHILLSVNDNDPAEKQKVIKEKTFEIYKLAKEGNDFAELARKFSDDKNSSVNGGLLPAFASGKMVEAFEEASFKLKTPGDISEPVQTSYGWHIIKLIEKKPVQKLEDLKPTLVKRIQRDDRSKMTRASFIKKIKADYKFKEYPANLKVFNTLVDSTWFAADWSVPAKAKLTKPVAEFNGIVLTQKDFADYLATNQYKQLISDVPTAVKAAYTKFIEDRLSSYEETNLEAKYPEFKALYKEYRDGILLFDLTNKMVWNKAVEDTTGLKAFYEQHKNEYMWKQRADAVIYKAKDKKTADAVVKLIKKGKKDEEIMKLINTDSQLNLANDEVVAEVGTNAVLDQFKWTTGLSEIKTIDGQQVFVNFRSVMAEQPKKLEETRGAVTAAYQNYLEENWIKELKARYKVEVNNDVLYSVQ